MSEIYENSNIYTIIVYISICYTRKCDLTREWKIFRAVMKEFYI